MKPQIYADCAEQFTQRREGAKERKVIGIILGEKL
jgi:hypothetical protein